MEDFKLIATTDAGTTEQSFLVEDLRSRVTIETLDLNSSLAIDAHVVDPTKGNARVRYLDECANGRKIEIWRSDDIEAGESRFRTVVVT